MMKKSNLYASVAALIFVVQGCSSPDKKAVVGDSVITVGTGTDSKTDTGFNTAGGTTKGGDKNKMKNLNDVTNESHADEDAANFMKAAALGGMMEVELGKIAQKSTHTGVKNFATLMVADHSKANKELKELALKMEILLPAEKYDEHKSHMEDMKKLSGITFDRHYVDMMVNDHAKTIKLFQQGADTREEAVRKFAEKMLPILNQHYTKALALQQELKKAK